ncbi:hypothetical protein OGATHE_004736 [Ogataea polymorpha]|uniref:Uncharacterized protein n=1 Tax=Ogataea polymorpha TaxID=460523 RepID=A0A9P8P126_9ASCO|nr:hypothetical protein OGATHE_004736 [Ogataea polymorpha]
MMVFSPTWPIRNKSCERDTTLSWDSSDSEENTSLALDFRILEQTTSGHDDMTYMELRASSAIPNQLPSAVYCNKTAESF